MAENSKIEWTDSTWNPWMGCTKVSPGCQHCYAETMMDHRYGKVKWGPQGARVRTSAETWKKPLRWNKNNWYECHDCGWRGSHDDTLAHADWEREICPSCKSFNTEITRQRMFCASLADMFEDNPQLDEWRSELFALIEATPNLDWLLLTKRPEKVTNMIPYTWLNNFPQNIWMGTSVESQKYADERVPALLRIPAKVRFLSCEPLLGHIDLSEAVEPDDEAWDEVNAEWDHDDEPEEFVEECEAELDWVNYGNDLVGNPEHREWTERRRARAGFKTLKHGAIDWVICGGESGPQARPMHPNWARSLRDECDAASVPFLFKQWGEWAPNITGTITSSDGIVKPMRDHGEMIKVGKHKAGRLLDGREWSEFPS
jgi:protein gp37